MVLFLMSTDLIVILEACIWPGFVLLVSFHFGCHLASHMLSWDLERHMSVRGVGANIVGIRFSCCAAVFSLAPFDLHKFISKINKFHHLPIKKYLRRHFYVLHIEER